MDQVNSGFGPDGVSRRGFVKTVGAAALVAAWPAAGVAAQGDAHSAEAEVEELMGRLYGSLTAEQRALVCYPFHHPRRLQVENHWAVARPTISVLSREQQALCFELFRSLCSDEGLDRFERQMQDDAGGFGHYHMALFGDPRSGESTEWVLTGRHVTLRARGPRAGGALRQGPVFYGHGAESCLQGGLEHSRNVWLAPARRAGSLFASLNGAQRARALVTTQGSPCAAGLAVAELDEGQKDMVRQLLDDLAMPFRRFPCPPGGVEGLRLTYFQEPGSDRRAVPSVWTLEGPALVWHYHGEPHVHAWTSVGPGVRPA